MKRRSCINFKKPYGCGLGMKCKIPCDDYQLRRKRKSKLYKKNRELSQSNYNWQRAYDREIKRMGLDN